MTTSTFVPFSSTTMDASSNATSEIPILVELVPALCDTIVGTVALLCILVVNVPVVYIVCVRRKMTHPVYCQYASVSVSNVLLGGASVVFKLLLTVSDKWHLPWSITILSNASISTISFVAIAILQYRAVSIARQGPDWRNKQLVTALILLVWLNSVIIWGIFLPSVHRTLPATTAISSNFMNNTVQIVTIVLITLLFPIVIIFTLSTAALWRISSKKYEDVSPEDSAREIQRWSSIERSLELSEKAVSTLMFNFLGFVLCWSPLVIKDLLDTFNMTNTSAGLSDFVGWLCYFHAAIQPACLIAVNEQFREGLKDICRCRLRNQSPDAAQPEAVELASQWLPLSLNATAV